MLQTLSPAGKPYFTCYDLEAIKAEFTPGSLLGRSADLWRYEEVRPWLLEAGWPPALGPQFSAGGRGRTGGNRDGGSGSAAESAKGAKYPLATPPPSKSANSRRCGEQSPRRQRNKRAVRSLRRFGGENVVYV